MTKDQVRSTEEALSLEQTLRLALEALEGNRRTHHYCEDTWYSCPKHEDGCANDSESDECNCGADKANAGIDQAIIAIKAALEAKDEPVAWKWHQAPVKTSWGDGMVVVDLAIDKDHTASIYCERDQTAKVEAMFITPPQRKPLTDDEINALDYSGTRIEFVRAIEAKLKEKNT